MLCLMVSVEPVSALCPGQSAAPRSWYLFGLQKGALGDLSPVVIVRNEFVVNQTVDTVGFYDGCLIQLIFLWVSGSFGGRQDIRKLA